LQVPDTIGLVEGSQTQPANTSSTVDQQSSINVFTHMIEMKKGNKEEYLQFQNEILPPREVQLQPKYFTATYLKEGIIKLVVLQPIEFSPDEVQFSQEYKATHMHLNVDAMNAWKK